ncbi:MAG TPA: glycine--tRNA ligase subunit beta [Thermoanaerobaculia bacterium]|jgi:glycyl-tRNA synthetase beta chain|nr:glycine--tRNA ligase subunit beta [Thermoanaerobaculia bacterium]
MPRGEYLLEVRSEEIPARMLEPGVRELATRVFEELMARGIGPREVETGYTPRRLVLILSGLPEGEPDREEQVMGPPVRAAFAADGKPTPALLGFAKRTGLPPDQLARVHTEKGEYLAATKKIAGRPTREVLAEIVPRILAGISWAKTMRWGSGTGPWVRPVHGVVSLLDGEVVPFELFGIAAGDTTEGHPTLSLAPFRVADVEDYRRQLAERHLEVRPAERRRALYDTMRDRASALGGRLVDDPVLLDKLTAICEIPGVMEGSFDDAFLELPAEVLATSLRDHQSALTVAAPGDHGKLLPYFLTVMDRPDDPAGRVRSGNEWVVAARLADARFFYGEDLKAGLVRRAEQLQRLNFHERLGSYAVKTLRLESLAATICDQLGRPPEMSEKVPAVEAARLLKVDLATEMVKEFTSLQGIMGGIYAREEGAPEAVWQAVYDQYLPASTEDSIPRGRVGQVVGLADRLDTLVGIFGLGLIPTGSKDPFGLRRAAQGVVRICLEGGLALDLERVAVEAAKLYGDRLTRKPEQILEDLRPFLADRIRYLLGLGGYAYDEIEAALAAGGSNLPDLRARVDALHQVRESAGFLTVVLAAKRIANIVKDAADRPFDAARLVEPAEKDLAAAFDELRLDIEEAAAAGDYERCLRRVADLAPVLDRFFVEVLVMAEDEAVRSNRIALLQAIGRTVSKTARLTEMVVDKAEARAKAG